MVGQQQAEAIKNSIFHRAVLAATAGTTCARSLFFAIAFLSPGVTTIRYRLELAATGGRQRDPCSPAWFSPWLCMRIDRLWTPPIYRNSLTSKRAIGGT
jgi:hypothetical protein